MVAATVFVFGSIRTNVCSLQLAVHTDPEPTFVGELLSEESLRRTGYFDFAAVRHWRKAFRQMRAGSLPRFSVEMGLAAVVATQLWHHLFIDGSLADLPTWTGISQAAKRENSLSPP